MQRNGMLSECHLVAIYLRTEHVFFFFFLSLCIRKLWGRMMRKELMYVPQKVWRSWCQSSGSGAGLGRRHSPGQADNEAQRVERHIRWQDRLMNIALTCFPLSLVCSPDHSLSNSHHSHLHLNIQRNTHMHTHKKCSLFPPSSWAHSCCFLPEND